MTVSIPVNQVFGQDNKPSILRFDNIADQQLPALAACHSTKNLAVPGLANFQDQVDGATGLKVKVTRVFDRNG